MVSALWIRRAKPGLPVFGGGDVTAVEISVETGELDPGHKLFGQHRTVRTGIGDKNTSPFSRIFDRDLSPAV